MDTSVQSSPQFPSTTGYLTPTMPYPQPDLQLEENFPQNTPCATVHPFSWYNYNAHTQHPYYNPARSYN